MGNDGQNSLQRALGRDFGLAKLSGNDVRHMFLLYGRALDLAGLLGDVDGMLDWMTGLTGDGWNARHLSAPGAFF